MPKQTRIGIALGAQQITAVVPELGAIVRVPCSVAPDHDAIENLVVLLLEVRAQLSPLERHKLDGARVDVALLPPLADSRLIPLPPLRPEEAEAVVRRDAARHFVGSNVARTFAVFTPPRSSVRAPVLAAAAATALLEQIHAAVNQLGWRVGSIVPAVSAWLAALQHSAGASAEPRVLTAQVADTVHVIRTEGAPVQLRRVPLAIGEELREAVANGSGESYIFAGPAERALLERALAGAGWKIEPEDKPAEAPVVAAQFAHAGELQLEPAAITLDRKQRQRQLARWFALVAPLLLIAAASAELWGARRELAAVRARRAEIRAEVAPLLAARDSIATLERRLGQINGLQKLAPRWTAALFDLAMLLPANTHLRSFNANGDTLVIEAMGSRAGETLQVLRSAPSLRDVRLKGQVQRDLEGGSTTTERFTLQARLAPRDSLVADSVRLQGSNSSTGRTQ